MKVLLRLGRFLFPLVTSLILMLLIWYVFLQAFPQVGPRVGKSPEDIWRYLVTSPGAPSARAPNQGPQQIPHRAPALGLGRIVAMPHRGPVGDRHDDAVGLDRHRIRQ
ncbi:hypothetical protein [Nocardia brasiliensis]|uniref:hypothetical protein n=1 Tax=Nocardia brasiliensis TaxID=37326 RepID=UPI00245781DB|nr:hypothetical protein [Nocardia brasiliensis]